MPPTLMSKKEFSLSTGQYAAQSPPNQQGGTASAPGNYSRRRPLEALQDDEWTAYFPPSVWRQGCPIEDKSLTEDQWKRLRRKHRASIENHPISAHLKVRMQAGLAKRLNADLDHMRSLSERE